MELLLGIVTGIIFGFLLQKAEVLRFERQVGFLCLKDMTIIKFMFSSILVGAVGIYLFKDLGVISLKIKATYIGGQVIGGLLFGIGWAIAGYCPGTSVGALGEGRVHCLWAILGMVAGAGLYAEAYPFMKKTVLTWGSVGEITLPGILHINHWFIVAALIIGVSLFFKWIESSNPRRAVG